MQADGPPARVVNDYLRYHLHDGLEIDDSEAIEAEAGIMSRLRLGGIPLIILFCRSRRRWPALTL